jgi:hypothetical protein
MKEDQALQDCPSLDQPVVRCSLAACDDRPHAATLFHPPDLPEEHVRPIAVSPTHVGARLLGVKGREARRSGSAGRVRLWHPVNGDENIAWPEVVYGVLRRAAPC